MLALIRRLMIGQLDPTVWFTNVLRPHMKTPQSLRPFMTVGSVKVRTGKGLHPQRSPHHGPARCIALCFN